MDQATREAIDTLVRSNPIVLFMKGTPLFPQCGFSGRAAGLIVASGIPAKHIKAVNILEDEALRQGIKEYSQWPTIPQLYVNGEFVGGSDILTEMHQAGELQQLLAPLIPKDA